MSLLDNVIWRQIYLNGVLIIDQPQALDFVGDNVLVETVNGRTQVSVSNPIDSKTSVRSASDGPLTMVGVQPVAGVALVAGNRVLVKNQADGSENGIRIVAAGAWPRSSDADSDADVTAGLTVYVEEGTQAGHWTLVTPNPITLDTTPLVFSRSVLQLTTDPPANVTKAAATVGVSATAARADHKHDASTAAPAAAGLATASAEGSATSLARSDHKHQANTAPVNVTKAAAAIGTSDEPARADHKHDASTAAPTATGVATAPAEGAATTLARSDHAHQANTAPVNVTKSAAAIGTSGEPARADHKHDITTAVAVAVGAANAEGSSTALARADHVHDASNLPTQNSTLDMGNQIISGIKAASFTSESDAGNSGASITIDFGVAHKRKVTLNAATPAITLQFPGVGNYQLKVFQDATGNRVPSFLVSGGVVYKAGGALSFSTAANARDILSVYFDGTDIYLAPVTGFAV